MHGAILVLNAGSSSLKFALYEAGVDRTPGLRRRGQVESIGTAPRLVIPDKEVDHALGPVDHAGCLGALRQWLEDDLAGLRLRGAGHRVVHGGPSFDAPALVDDALLDALERLVPLAPLHQPHNLAAIRALRTTDPALPQVACFDTAFHRGRPAVADHFALPEDLFERGIRRYGFHGLSYEWVTRRLTDVAPEVAQGRIIVAHLGSGASLCAIHRGRPVDTSMGFTPLGGVPMGTRPGSLDPGVVLHLMGAEGYDAKGLEELLYHRSGLLGVSGISNDMRTLLESSDQRAARAVELFVERTVQQIGGYVATLGGLDALVFTAGIGERSPLIRERIVARFGWLGVALEEAANRRHATCISPPGMRPLVLVIPTDEEQIIARHTAGLLGGWS